MPVSILYWAHSSQPMKKIPSLKQVKNVLLQLWSTNYLGNVAALESTVKYGQPNKLINSSAVYIKMDGKSKFIQVMARN